MAMRAYFFLSIWKNYINQCSILHSTKLYNMNISCISTQSFNIFCSLAESLVLLILAHRDYYPNYSFFPWEYGTEALEHLFGIARQLMPDFSYYELYKILNRVQYRDNILRSENISNIQEKQSVSGKLYFKFYFYINIIFINIKYYIIIGYIFDFDTCISDMDIDKLRSWPSDDEINDAIRITHENADAFTKLLNMHKQLKNNTISDVLTPEANDNNSQLKNDEILQKLNKISQLDDHLNNYFKKNIILKDSDSELNKENYGDNSEDLLEINTVDAENFIKKTEINYIINNSKSNISEELDYEYEDKIFRNDGSCDISLMLKLRKSHEAFSHSDRPRGIQTRIIRNLNQESQNRIDRNLANHLINQLSDNQNHQIIKKRTQRWKGRNQLQSLVNSNQIQGKYKYILI